MTSSPESTNPGSNAQPAWKGHLKRFWSKAEGLLTIAGLIGLAIMVTLFVAPIVARVSDARGGADNWQVMAELVPGASSTPEDRVRLNGYIHPIGTLHHQALIKSDWSDLSTCRDWEIATVFEFRFTEDASEPNHLAIVTQSGCDDLQPINAGHVVLTGQFVSMGQLATPLAQLGWTEGRYFQILGLVSIPETG